MTHFLTIQHAFITLHHVHFRPFASAPFSHSLFLPFMDFILTKVIYADNGKMNEYE